MPERIDPEDIPGEVKTMKMKRPATLASVVIVFTLISAPRSHSAAPEETLGQYLSDLRKNPDDQALREKIIGHVRTMSPVPKIPAEVDELVGQAKYVFKHAKEQKDYLDAIEAFKKVTDLAPWVGDYYFNLGVAQEKAGESQGAIRSFSLYLVASPDAKDAREIRERIGGLKYSMEKARKEQQAAEAKARAEQEQREVPRRFLNQLRTFYGGKSFRVSACSHTPTYQICFNEAGVWPCGCDEAEMRGSNWYKSGDSRVQVSFPDDTTILLTRGTFRLKGTVTGGGAENITWEMPEPDSRKANKWKPVWGWAAHCTVASNRIGPLDCLIYSNPYYDFPGMKPPSRPVNSSEFSPSMRYEYFLLDDPR